MINRTIFAVALLAAFSSPARAQCRDWKDGFGIPGLGSLSPARAAGQFDDGGGNRLYVAGSFPVAGGNPKHTATWDGTSWSLLPDTFNDSVSDFAVHDDGSGPALYTCGRYTYVNGAIHLHVSKRVGGVWQQVGSGIGSEFLAFDRVNTLCSHDDGTGAKLYAGGSFTEMGGAPVANIAVWDGVSWSPLGVGVDGEVFKIASYAGRLYVAGNFTHAGGAPAMRIASWDGTAWSTVGPVLGSIGNPQVNALHVADLGAGPRLYVAGHFTTLGGQPCSQLLAWDGSSYSQIPLQSPGYGSATELMSHDDGTGVGLYLAGQFSSVDGIATNWIARWDGSAWSGLQGGVNSYINAMQSFQGDLYVFGELTTAGGKPSNGIGVWSTPCAVPGFLQHPVGVTAAYGTDPRFSVRASGLHPMTYQWYRDGVPVQDSQGVSGAQTPELRFQWWSYGDHGQYTCVLTNALGSTESNPAEFVVPAGGQSGIPVAIEPLLTVPATAQGLQPGETITGFTNARQGWTGEVLATGTVAGDGMPFLLENGQWRLLLRRYDPAPGMPAGTTFGRASGGALLGNIQMGMNSNLLIEAYVDGPGLDASTGQGYWFSDPAGLELVARPTMPAPGTTPGATFKNLRFPALRNSRVYFTADAYMGSTFLHTAIWSWDRTQGLQLALQGGMNAPGTGTTFDAITGGCGPTEADEIVLIAGFGGGQAGVFSGPATNLQLLERSGDPQPGSPAGVNITAFEGLAVESASEIAVVTNSPLSGVQRRSLHTIRQGVVTPVLQTGTSAPDSGIMTFFSPRPIAMNANGSVLFYSNLQGQCGTCPGWGVWLADAAGNLETILLNRSQVVPGLLPGHVIQDVGAMALDESDRVLMNVSIHYGSSYQAIYGWTREAGLFPVATAGDQFEIAPSTYATVRSARLLTPSGTSTSLQPAALSDTGSFTFGLTFFDWSVGTYAGNFSTLLAAIVGSGTTFCTGDGTGTACPCGNDSVPGEGEGCANSLGHGGTLRASGVASLSSDTLRLVGDGMPNSSALYFQGTTQAGNGQGTTFGDGLRCASGTIRRLGTRTNSSGTSSVPDLGGTPLSVIGSVNAPGDRMYQVWYRNAAAFCTSSTFNFTNGVLVSWSP